LIPKAIHGKKEGSDPEQNDPDAEQKSLSCDRENRGKSPIPADTRMPGTFFRQRE